MVSKNDRMSASSTQFTSFRATASASSASCCDRPGRKPYENPRNAARRSAPGSSAPPAGRSCPPARGCRAAACAHRLSGCARVAPAADDSSRDESGPADRAVSSQLLAVLSHVTSSTPGAACLRRRAIRLLEQRHLDVAEQVGELLLLLLLCFLADPLQVCERGFPPLCALVRVSLIGIPLGRWSFPPSTPRALPRVRRLLRYYDRVRLLGGLWRIAAHAFPPRAIASIASTYGSITPSP